MFDDLDLLIPKAPEVTDSFTWATVTSISPVMVRFDGDTATLPAIDLVGSLSIGSRVRCAIHSKQLFVTDRLGGRDLSAYATKASPTLTGTVTVPTAAANTNNTQAASTAFVQTEIMALPASYVTSGTFDITRIPTGTAATQVAIGNHTHTKANITDFAHTHVIADTTGLQSALDTKQAAGAYAAASHTHTVSQLTDFATVVSGTLAANNYYEKYANGQLICRGMQSFATGSQAYTWTYPVAFVGQLPQIITNHGTTAPESLASAHSSDALTSVIIEHNRSTSGSTTLYYSAMGRWK